ncbi:neuropeptide receptor [Echinococcus multilocularis]|uniref:Neuropeptide receptor n=1 Tax=Echinococcus multilocularis TaxID=6211 RepID=A0A068YB14_ECHMU|nr:neuropeptide receptor [Echinococcus multilocularis]
MPNIGAPPGEVSTFEWGPLIHTVVFIIYGVIIILSLFGNTIVILVILRCKSMQSMTNIFITNLAVSDLLMSLVAAPFTPIAVFSDTWVLPQLLCKLLSFTMGVSVYVSTLTSTAIAVDRYLVIVHPFFSKMRKWMCGTIIATIWAIATLICLPLAIHQTTTVDPILNVTICTEFWPPGESRRIFSILSFVFQFVAPSVVITFCYFYVSRLLRNRRQQKLGSRLRSTQKQDFEARRHNKTNRMLIAMVVVFVVCWIPLNALSIYSDIKTNDPNFTLPYFNAIFVTCHIIAMSSAVYNPLLYAWLSETFRRNLRTLVPRWRVKSGAVGVLDDATAVDAAAEAVLRTSGVNDINLARKNIESQTCSGDGKMEVLPYIQLQGTGRSNLRVQNDLKKSEH